MLKIDKEIKYTNVNLPGLFTNNLMAATPYVVEGSSLNPNAKIMSTGTPIVNIIDVDFCGLVLNKLVGEESQSISNSSDLFEKMNNMINQINALSVFVESVMNIETK